MKKLLVIPVLLVGSLAGIQQAQSKVCCDPWGWVGYAAFMSAGSAVVTAITASATTVVNGLIMVQQSWSQGFQGWMGEQTTASAQRVQIKEARVTTDATRSMDLIVANAQVQHAPTPMQDQTVTNALVVSESTRAAAKNTASLAKQWGDQFIGKRQDETTAYAIVLRHSSYCDAAAVAAGCKKLAPAALQNADIDIKTIFQPGDGLNPTLSDEERDAAVALIKNITNPIAATTPATSSDMYDAILMSDKAALSASALSLQSILAHRTRRHAFQ